MTEQVLIRVLLVDDHDAVRRGLTLALQVFDDLVLVGEAVNGKEAVTMCADVVPDVVLMDLVMPEVDGITATRAIRTQCPLVQVVALTGFNDMDLIQLALQAGAVNYVIKDASIDDLAAAIRDAYAHNAAAASPPASPETSDRT